MKILVIGGGGREHAVAWKLNQSPQAEKIFCAPGNAGINEIAEPVDIKVTDNKKLVRFAKENEIDLTIVGPEVPLVNGIVDDFKRYDLKIFGPDKDAAMLEGSKVFAKKIMDKYNIPTARYKEFTDPKSAKEFVKDNSWARIVKADGLAAGKGVYVCKDAKEAILAIEEIMEEKRYGEAGKTIIIEERLVGEEASFLALSDGKTIKPLITSQDHKPAYDNDQGPNTGGMGAYAPAPIVNTELNKKIMETVMQPLIKGMALEGKKYVGVIYAGLMIDKGKIKVLEFNCRFGDPEAQPLLFLLKSDLAELMTACINGNLENHDLIFDDMAACCVIMASGGYPKNYQKGKEITIASSVIQSKDVFVFHSGTRSEHGKLLTDGGRVLGVTAKGTTIEQAITKAYTAVKQIHFDDCHFRTDIGKKALKRQKNMIRQDKLKERKSMPEESVKKKSKIIIEKLIKHDMFKSANNILIYSPIDNEVIIDPMADVSKRFYLPKIISDGIKYGHYKNKDSLIINQYNIPEPKETCSDNLDLVIVPGIAFSKEGHRLGYGKGNYDRLLKKISAPKIGLAYKSQITNFPTEDHDEMLDLIITEQETISTKTNKIAILASTNGTDMQAIIGAIENNELDAEIKVVISDKECHALERAKNHNIKAVYIDPDGTTREEFDKEISKIIDDEKATLIILIGYMKLMSEMFVEKYRNKIMNIHPSLLPAFAGGMDLNVHEEVLKRGCKVTGASLIFIDEGVDTGPIISQAVVPVGDSDTPDSLKEKVQAAEQKLLLDAIPLYFQNRFVVEKNRVKII